LALTLSPPDIFFRGLPLRGLLSSFLPNLTPFCFFPALATSDGRWPGAGLVGPFWIHLRPLLVLSLAFFFFVFLSAPAPCDGAPFALSARLFPFEPECVVCNHRSLMPSQLFGLFVSVLLFGACFGDFSVFSFLFPKSLGDPARGPAFFLGQTHGENVGPRYLRPGIFSFFPPVVAHIF